MFGQDYDSDAIICPYCGHKEYPEVGFSLGHHTCEGTIQAELQKKKQRDAYQEEQRLRRQEIDSKADFLMMSGFVDKSEALWLARDWHDNEDWDDEEMY